MENIFLSSNKVRAIGVSNFSIKKYVFWAYIAPGVGVNCYAL